MNRDHYASQLSLNSRDDRQYGHLFTTVKDAASDEIAI